MEDKPRTIPRTLVLRGPHPTTGKEHFWGIVGPAKIEPGEPYIDGCVGHSRVAFWAGANPSKVRHVLLHNLGDCSLFVDPQTAEIVATSMAPQKCVEPRGGLTKLCATMVSEPMHKRMSEVSRTTGWPQAKIVREALAYYLERFLPC